MRIIISGDSFTYGQGCDDRISFTDPVTGKHEENFTGGEPPSKYCWASLLQEHYPEHEIINLSKPGEDNTNISMSISDNINDADIVFFAGTTFNRLQVSTKFDNRLASWVMGVPLGKISFTDDHRKASELFLKYLYAEEYFINVTVAMIWSVYGQCLQKNKQFLWSSAPYGLNGNDYHRNKVKNHRLMNLDTMLKDTKIPSLFSYFQHEFVNNKPYLHKDSHANNLGHKYYFDHEILPVFKKLIK